MPLTFEFYNSTAAPIAIDDVPVPFTVPANGSILSPGGNSETDLRQSLLILQFSREEKLDMLLNGETIDIHKPGMAFVVAGSSVTQSFVEAAVAGSGTLIWDTDTEAWADFYVRLAAASPRPDTVLVQGAGGSVTPGVFNTVGVTFSGNARDIGGQWPLIEFLDGAIFQSWIAFRQCRIQADCETTGIFQLVTNIGANISFDDCEFTVGGGAGVNAISFAGPGPLPFSVLHHVSILNKSQISGFAPFVVFEYSGLEILNVLLTEGSTVLPFTFSGGIEKVVFFADTTVYIDPAAIVTPGGTMGNSTTIFDTTNALSSGTVNYNTAENTLHTPNGVHAAGFLSDGPMYVDGTVIVDPTVNFVDTLPAVASFKHNVGVQAGIDGYKVYNVEEPPLEFWFAIDNDEGTGNGVIKPVSDGTLRKLVVYGAPILLSSEVEHDNALYTNPHVLEGDASPYTVLATDHIIVVAQTTPGAIELLLPAAINGRRLIIKDGLGDAFTNNITLTPDGAETIDGAANYVINTNRGCVEIAAAYIASVWSWVILNRKIV